MTKEKPKDLFTANGKKKALPKIKCVWCGMMRTHYSQGCCQRCYHIKFGTTRIDTRQPAAQFTMSPTYRGKSFTTVSVFPVWDILYGYRGTPTKLQKRRLKVHIAVNTLGHNIIFTPKEAKTLGAFLSEIGETYTKYKNFYDWCDALQERDKK